MLNKGTIQLANVQTISVLTAVPSQLSWTYTASRSIAGTWQYNATARSQQTPKRVVHTKLVSLTCSMFSVVRTPKMTGTPDSWPAPNKPPAAAFATAS